MFITKIYIVNFKMLAFAERAAALILLLFYASVVFAQQEKKFIKDGNKQYSTKNFVDAEKNYKEGLTKNKDSYKGNFNLGDTYYKQGKFEEASEQFQMLTHRATSKDTLSKAYHNLGNSLVQSKKYEEGVNAYKNALKNNPNDEDTRYNLAYAQKMMQQQQKDDKNKDNKDNKDKKDNKDNKDDKKDKDKKDKDEKNKDKKDKDQKDNKDKEQQKPEQNQISKQDAQRLLDALQNDEKNLQDKMKKEKVKGMKVQIDKDW